MDEAARVQGPVFFQGAASLFHPSVLYKYIFMPSAGGTVGL